MDTGDWRNQLPLDSRQRIVNKIMDTLKRHLPVSCQEGLHELKKMAIRFEEKIYTAATSQSDYLQKISLKMLAMETKSQNPVVNSLPSNAAGSSNEHPDSGAHIYTSVVASLDSMAQTGHAKGGDWQEEACQELKAIKEKLESYEKQILDFINTNGARNPVASLQQGQLPLPHVHSMHQPESPITKMQSHENQMNPQLQSMNLQGSVSSLDSTAQTGHANGGDWQEEVYQKIKAMKEMYLPEINEMHQKIATKLQQYDSLPQQPKSDQLEKLKMFRTMLERIITFLQVPKSSILPNFKEKLGSYEKQILNFINANKPRKPVSSLQHGQTGHANGGDWQEEVYQKIKAMKEMYLPEINEMHQKIATKLQQYDSLPQQPKSDQLEKLKMFRTMLERIITFLQVPKSSILPNFKEKLGSYEKQILNFINANKPRKPVSSLQQGQLPPPHMHSMQQPQSQITWRVL